MEKDQIPLFVDDLTEAIRATINALGGFKTIGVELRPEKSAVDAGKWLADCLNGDKRDKLDPEQLAYIRRKARQQGVHLLAAYEMREAGYSEPQPIEPEDERAALQREFVQASKGMQALFARMERAGLKAVA